jgi:hypothetical protein
LQAIIDQLEALAGMNQRLTRGRTGNLSFDANRFFGLKRPLLQADTPAGVVDEFSGLKLSAEFESDELVSTLAEKPGST